MDKKSKDELFWFCPKCNSKISINVDMDYHENVVHPDMDNLYVRSWHLRGRPGLSPYD